MKKTLAILLALAMVFSTVTVAFAEEPISADAQVCVKLDMLKGNTSAGVTADYLATAPTRIQAAILFLRLRGLEDAAKNFQGTENFVDASEAAWAEPIMAYLKANKELGWQGDNGKFSPNAPITAQAYYKVMLEALGYKQNTADVIGDFTWAGVIDFAATKGLVKVADVANFTVNDVAVATVEALKGTIKGTEKSLIESIVADNADLAAPAKAAGLILPVVTEVTGVDTMTTATIALGDTTAVKADVIAKKWADTVKVTLDNGDVKTPAINWDFSKLVDVTKGTTTEHGYVGTLVSDGTYKIPAEKANVSIIWLEQAPTVKGTVTAPDMTVANNTAADKLGLPTTVKVNTLVFGKEDVAANYVEKTANVAWDTTTYVATQVGEQTITGKVTPVDAADFKVGKAGLNATVKVTVGEAATKVVSLSAVKANALEVTFSKAVDTAKAAFTLKKGTIAVNVKSIAWNEAKTVATLTGFVGYAAGTYNVTVSGLDLVAPNNAATVDVAAQRVAGITVNGDVAPLAVTGGTAADVTFNVVDQYGTDVTTTLGAALTVSSTATGVPAITASTKTVTINWLATPAVDSPVVVTLIDPTTGVVGTKTFKVGKPSAASTITLGALTNKDNKVLRTDSNPVLAATDLFQFDVNAVDQYGTTVTSATQLGTDFIVLPSDVALTSTFVNATATAPAKLKITGVPALAGTYTITLVSRTTGASVVAVVPVEKAIGLDSFSISAPADTLYVNEYVDVPYVAADQYGTAINKHSVLNGVPNISVSDADYSITWEKNAVDGTAKLRLTANAGALTTDNVVVTAIYNGKVSTFTIKPLAAAVPTRISAVKADTVKNMTIGGTVTLAATNFEIRDQYERVMTLPGTWSLDVATSDAAKVSVAGTTLTGVAAGSSTITVKLVNAVPTIIGTSAYEFTANTVAKADVVSYVIDTTDKVFVNTAAWAGASAEEKAYKVAIEVYGKTAAGDKVALKATDIVSLNSTNAKVDLASAVGYLYANGTLAAGVDEEAATLVAIINGANGVETVTKTITLTDAAKTYTAIVAKATTADVVSFENGIAVMTAANVNAMSTKIASSHAQYVTNRASVYFEVKDQYGVASAAVAPAYYTLSATNAAGGAAVGSYAIAPTTGVLTISGAASGEIITITGITADGKTAVIKIIVQ